MKQIQCTVSVSKVILSDVCLYFLKSILFFLLKEDRIRLRRGLLYCSDVTLAMFPQLASFQLEVVS